MVATRRNNKKQSGYQKGDKVEVTRPPTGMAAIGTLVSRQKKQQQRNNSLWVIEYENHGKGIISERSIQRLLSSELLDAHHETDDTAAVVTDTSCSNNIVITTTTTTTKTTKPKQRYIVHKQKGITTRLGRPVRKTVMKTGILYIYLETRRAEFVRTK